jgi:hypothetical protein
MGKLIKISNNMEIKLLLMKKFNQILNTKNNLHGEVDKKKSNNMENKLLLMKFFNQILYMKNKLLWTNFFNNYCTRES